MLTSRGGDCERVFVHVGDIADIWRRTVENGGLGKLKTFTYQ